MRPAIGVKNGPWGDGSVSDCHVQGVNDQAGAHMRGQLPPDDHTRGEVDHGREVEPSLTGFEVGDVADEPLSRLLRGELAINQVRAVDGLFARHCGALVGAGLARRKAKFTHEVGDQPDAAGVAFTVELGGDTATAIRASSLGEHPGDVRAQLTAASLGGRLGGHPLAPGVKRRAWHPK
ncbi:hypothetical protein GCM10027597_62800 [Saccharopolyspora tripterygii]